MDRTKASVKPLKEGSATVTVASEGEQEMALCDITIKAVKKEPENVAASRKSGMSGAGIRVFSAAGKEIKNSRFCQHEKTGTKEFLLNVKKGQAPSPGRCTGPSACLFALLFISSRRPQQFQMNFCLPQKGAIHRLRRLGRGALRRG